MTKVGNFKPDNTITYDITVNQSGKEVPDAKVTDILKTPNISYVKDSFEIYKDVTQVVRKVDPKAFVNILKTDQVAGNFYQRPND